MPPRNPASSPLAARLLELGISPQELADIVGRPQEEVERWVAAESLGGEAAVLLRPIFASDESAMAAVERIRRTFHRTWEGDRVALDNTVSTVGPPVRDGARYGAAS